MRSLTLDRHYLILPVEPGAEKTRLALEIAGTVVREFDIELSANPLFEVYLDVSEFSGSEAILKPVDAESAPGLEQVRTADDLPGLEMMRCEALRPQFHFTSRRGWLNDPNGLVYHEGLWHLYYQHNPYGTSWGNMHWGHAVSDDLLHWRELGEAVYPKAYGDWAYSGSGFVGDDGALWIAWTSTGRGECIARSDDGGKTFVELPENPVVTHRGRDPKVIRHPQTGQWVMAVYDEDDPRESRRIDFHVSDDLHCWEKAGRIEGFYECPDLFFLPVDGNPEHLKWVLYGADGEYVVGEFDGREFHCESEGKLRLWFGDFYAAQTYSDAPGDRRVQIGWGRNIVFPGMPFSQQMTFPCELRLASVAGGIRMLAEPVAEIERLRKLNHSYGDLPLDGREHIARSESCILDMDATFTLLDADSSAGLEVRGVPVVYDKAAGELCVGDLRASLQVGETLRLRILLDAGSIEIFAENGRIAVSKGVIFPAEERSVAAVGSKARLETLDIYPLRSVWP